MKLPSYVKPYSWLMHEKKAKGFTSFITGKIYFPKETFENLKSQNPDPQSIGFLKHEEAHLKSFKGVNLLKYLFKFLTSRKFRLEGELNAYKEQFKYLKEHNLTYDLERVAKNLSGKTYFWLTSYKNAKALVEKAWNEA